MRWLSGTNLGCLAVALLAGCAGEQRQTQVVSARPPVQFVAWELPPEPEEVQAVRMQQEQSSAPCRMWFESVPTGIAITFAPRDPQTRSVLQRDVRQLATALRSVDVRPEPTTPSPSRIAEAPSAVPKPNDASVREQALTEEAAAARATLVPGDADSDYTLGPAREGSAPVDEPRTVGAERLATHGVRQIMALDPDLFVDNVSEGVRLTFATSRPEDVRALRANVRWHAADLIPETAERPEACVRTPGLGDAVGQRSEPSGAALASSDR